MKTVPSVLSDELVKEANHIVHLVTMYLSSTAYYTDFDIDYVYGGNTYLSRGLKFSAAQYGLDMEVDAISFEIDNVSLEFSSIVLNEEVRGKNCDIQIAALDVNLQVIGASGIFKGILDSPKVDDKRTVFDVYTPLILWKKKTPRRNHAPSCPWTFKGTECAYAGSDTWCDQSYERCGEVTPPNTNNFGGFRFLPQLQTQKIWWGRKPG